MRLFRVQISTAGAGVLVSLQCHRSLDFLITDIRLILHQMSRSRVSLLTLRILLHKGNHPLNLIFVEVQGVRINCH